MFTCKQVSHSLSKEDYAKLPPAKRFFLRLHVKLCIFCGKFNRQVMDGQDMCRHFKQHEATNCQVRAGVARGPERRVEGAACRAVGKELKKLKAGAPSKVDCLALARAL